MSNLEIFPYYKNSQQWKIALNNWVKTKERNNNITKEEIECYFYSAFSCANYEAYEKGIVLIEQNTKINVKFHTLTCNALKLYLSGQYTKAARLAKEAAEHVSENKNERLYFFQLYKEIKLKSALAKRKPLKEKLSYLKYKYFEISGNLLYSTDILGIVLFLKYKKNHSDSIYANKIKNAINRIYEKTKNFKGDLNKLDLHIKENKLTELTTLANLVEQKEKLVAIGFGGIQLIIISKILATAMHMQASFIVRQLAKQYFIDNKELFYRKHNVLYLYSVRACLEQKVPTCTKGFTQPERYHIALEHIKLYTTKKQHGFDFFKEIRNKNDIEYKKYIENKRIAIVGPVKTGLKNGKDIDSYDIVIRLNTASAENYPEEFFGKKTSAAYFCRNQIEEKTELLSTIDKLDFISFQSIREDKFCSEIEKSNKIRTTLRYYERANNIFFSGYPNHIQRVILDIIRFNPKEIKIFNANLWIKNIPSEFYIYKQQFYPANLILHDIYSNFILTQRMYKNGYIKADKILSEILEMSTNEYAEKMIYNYGNQYI